MPFFSKFSAKILGYLSRQNKANPLEQFVHIGTREFPQWISIAANKNSFEGSVFTREIEVHTKKDATLARIALLPENRTWAQTWVNQNSLGSIRLNNDRNQLSAFNDLIDQLIEKKIHTYQRKLQVLDNKTFSANEVSTEDKALEWMKVSFLMLEKAIVKSLTDSELLFQTLLFMGENPKTGLDEIRLITFNLDIKFEFLPNNLLRVRIYNDKNEEFGSSKKAALEGDFNFRKREMLDELTKLLSAVSSGLKF